MTQEQYQEGQGVKKNYSMDIRTGGYRQTPEAKRRLVQVSDISQDLTDVLDALTTAINLIRLDVLAIKAKTKAVLTANALTIAGDFAINGDGVPTSGTYVAQLDQPIEGVAVKFTLATFAEADIESVEGTATPADLVGAGVTVLTDATGKASLDIEFALDVDKSGVLTAGITAGAYKVDTTATATDTIVADTLFDDRAATVVMTGAEAISADNLAAQETFSAQLDVAVAGIPVVFTLATFLEADIDAVSGGEVAALLAAGISVDTDATGLATLDITFAANVAKTGILTSTITDTERRVQTTDSDTLTLVVDTTAVV